MYVLGQTAGWFACVLGAAHDRHWPGVLGVTALLVLHLITRGDRSACRILALVLLALLFGLLFDSLLILVGVYVPIRWLVPYPFATIWLMALWGNFALIVDVPLRWLQHHLVAAAVFGSLFGPMAYVAAQRLGAIQIAEPAAFNIAALSAAWALGLAALMFLAKLLPVFPPRRQAQTEP